ncbi:potassium/proton antiporter, partial [Mesorhizobium sp. B263B1A]|nr:potassium/proton antiporter [Mesorhizobium sp. B263B1A]
RTTARGRPSPPPAPGARVPVFLSAGEIADRIKAFVQTWRKPVETPIAEAHADEKPEPAVEKATTES